ncbi:unnamed protein product [Brassica oleracea var. botrytis]|uniref:Uncharacterized protein n=3 Tax=Brassica TaxID=3705 RepID=A0A0D3E4W5_BRAOL|nr:unnamed protein product [Brassica napus]CDY19530.1 BnaC09g13730D [Brassica napus]VDD29579.1 unnamed protein product [Brassica oleracea]
MLKTLKNLKNLKNLNNLKNSKNLSHIFRFSVLNVKKLYLLFIPPIYFVSMYTAMNLQY